MCAKKRKIIKATKKKEKKYAMLSVSVSVTTQGKALATYALSLKRTSHN